MKIISKYKDFYDYMVQDYDADLTYIRSPRFISEYYDNLFKKNNINTPYFSPNYGYIDRYSRAENGELRFDNFIFGIYPFVYSQPILRIYYTYKEWKAIGKGDNTFIILGKEIVDKILNAKDDDLKYILESEVYPIAQKEFDKKVNEGLCNPTKVHFYRLKPNLFKETLQENVWKIDCTDIFYKLEAPVFVKYYSELIQYINNDDQYEGTDSYIHYVANISFQKLYHNILKYWYNDLFDLNTYINIENFLWSIKQEPESHPDNKTKILAHGFDLKTSFRKM